MNKKEMSRIIFLHLEKNPLTSVESIRNVVERELERIGDIGEKSKSFGMVTQTWYDDISDRHVLLINEIIYDLLSKRILTPGVNRSNLELPRVHVIDMDKLEEELEKR